MRILFSIRLLGSFWIFESALRRLALEGHDLLILAKRRDSLELGSPPETLFSDVPGIRWRWEDDPRNAWTAPAAAVRAWLDYLRYFEPLYANAGRLRTRAGEYVPAVLRRITEWPLVRTTAARRTLVSCLRAIERALPRQPWLDKVMSEYRPDAVLVTPLVPFESDQVEVLRSARAFGTRTALCVASWDHLSSKGRIAELPDRVFVWNKTQVWETEALHAIPSDRVVVTGAQCYDHWFGRTPVRTREQFCTMLKLPVDRPFLLYVCSALHTTTEAHFVRSWIEDIRATDDAALRSASILIRPHPSRLDEWREVDLSDLRDVTLYGRLPVDEHAKEDYFESLYYSAAVIGLNTSAFLEAAIVGRPVHTIVLAKFKERQEGTLHFNYLLSAGGGVLRLARSFDEHRAQLAASLRETPPADLNTTFVSAFIRPHGLAAPATPLFCEAVEDLLRMPVPAAARLPFWHVPLRWAVWPALGALLWISGAEVFRDAWSHMERRSGYRARRARRERELQRQADERLQQKRRQAADRRKHQHKRARAETLAVREAALRTKRASRKLAAAEKAATRRVRAREKALRIRQRKRAAMAARLKQGVHRWFEWLRRGGHGQAM